MAILGIDLGTSNTLVAKLNSDGDPEIIEVGEDKLVPSVIYMEEQDGNTMVGNHALDMWADPDYESARGFRRWKLKMGEDHVIRKLAVAGGKANDIVVTPEHLTTLMVEHLVRTISQGDDGEKVDAVLVTVPHGWRREKPEKCRATRIAAANAKHDGKPVTVQELTVSEPVAAAAYWLWVAQKKAKVDEFNGKTLMVCDVGGGTFDLSLVQVGDISKPLDVVNAENNDYAGDYTDALLCAWVCRQFNVKFDTSYSESAEEILETIESDQHNWLREWFVDVKKPLKEKLCDNIEAVQDRNKPIESARAVKKDFRDPQNNHLQIILSVDDLVSCLQPFYEESRKLIRHFLGKIKDRNPAQLPYALVFAGGGSRIHGIKEHVILPVLKEIYGKESTVQEVVNRIETNLGRRDQVIAMGAALIANGVVSVQERLLHDIGMVASLGTPLLSALKLPPETANVILSPLIPRSSPLPAKITSADLGLPCSIEAGQDLQIDIVIDDDSKDPWIQHWVLPHPSKGTTQSVKWEIEADTDGALTMHLKPASGQSIKVEGRLERRRTGRASIVIGDIPTNQDKIPRIAPQFLVETWKKLGGVA